MSKLLRNMPAVVVLGSITLIVPWLALIATGKFYEAIGPDEPWSRGDMPGSVQLVTLSLAGLFTGLLRPSLVAMSWNGSLSAAVIASGLWALAGTALWLSLLFFAGSLAPLDRVFPLAYIAVLVGLLLALRLRSAQQVCAALVAVLLIFQIGRAHV